MGTLCDMTAQIWCFVPFVYRVQRVAISVVRISLPPPDTFLPPPPEYILKSPVVTFPQQNDNDRPRGHTGSPHDYVLRGLASTVAVKFQNRWPRVANSTNAVELLYQPVSYSRHVMVAGDTETTTATTADAAMDRLLCGVRQPQQAPGVTAEVSHSRIRMRGKRGVLHTRIFPECQGY